MENNIKIGVEAEDKFTAVFAKLDKTLLKLNTTLKKFSSSVAFMTRKMTISNNTVSNSSKHLMKLRRQMKKLKQATKSTGKTFEKTKKKMEFDGDAMGIMFFGMAIQKWAVGGLTAMFESYKKIIPESSEFNRQTTVMSANWELFKFQLADALTKSPMFQVMTQKLISMLKTFQALSPETKKWIGYLTAGMAVLGGSMFIFGTMTLGIKSVIGKLMSLGGAFEAVGTKGLGFKDKLSSLGKGIGIAAGVTLTVTGITKVISAIKGGDTTSLVGNGIATALALAGTISMFFNPAIGFGLIAASAITMKITDIIVEIRDKEAAKENIIKAVNPLFEDTRNWFERTSQDWFGGSDLEPQVNTMFDGFLGRTKEKIAELNELKIKLPQLEQGTDSEAILTARTRIKALTDELVLYKESVVKLDNVQLSEKFNLAIERADIADIVKKNSKVITDSLKSITTDTEKGTIATEGLRKQIQKLSPTQLANVRTEYGLINDEFKILTDNAEGVVSSYDQITSAMNRQKKTLEKLNEEIDDYFGAITFNANFDISNNQQASAQPQSVTYVTIDNIDVSKNKGMTDNMNSFLAESANETGIDVGGLGQ